MSILIDKETKVVVKVLPAHGTFHSEQAIKYGTKLVGGVTPNKRRTETSWTSVFDTVKDAIR